MLEFARKIHIKLMTFDEIRLTFSMKHGSYDEKLLVNFQRMLEGTGKLLKATCL